MLYAIVDNKTGWSLKLVRDKYHFMPNGFPALLPLSPAIALINDYAKNSRACTLRKEVD